MEWYLADVQYDGERAGRRGREKQATRVEEESLGKSRCQTLASFAEGHIGLPLQD